MRTYQITRIHAGVACFFPIIWSLIGGIGLATETKADVTNYYPFKRHFQPVTVDTSSPLTAGEVREKALRLTGIVGPFPVRTNYAETVLQTGLAWMQTNPLAAWTAATGIPAYQATYTNEFRNDAAWLAGIRADAEYWGAFHWYLQNRIEFVTPTQTVWFSPYGVSNNVVRVMVGSVGDFNPGEVGQSQSPTPPLLSPAFCMTTQTLWRVDLNAYLRLLEARWITPHTQDSDDDCIPDYADGYNADAIDGNSDDRSDGDVLARWDILLPPIENPDTFLIRITYAPSDPLEVVRDGPDAGFRPGPGSLRLWLRSAQALRNGLPHSMGGDYLPPGTYSASELGLDADSTEWTLFLEMIRSGAEDFIHIDWSADNGLHWRPMERLELYNIVVDLDVDSDNNNGFHLPARTATEDSIEGVAHYRYLPGKIIGVARGDADGDHIPDFADGFDADPQDPQDDQSPHGLVPLIGEIAVPDGRLSQEARIKFQYSGAPDPAISVTSTQVDWSCQARRVYQLADTSAALRIWRTANPESRRPQPLSQGGDYVVPDQYYPLSFFTNSGSTFTVYVEALRPSANPGDYAVRMIVDPDGLDAHLFEDEVRFSAIALDLQLFNANSIRLSLDDQLNELWEDDQPFYFWVNDGWDNPFIITRDSADAWITGYNDLLDIAPLAVRYSAPFPSDDLPSTWKFRWRLIPALPRTQQGGVRIFENRVANSQDESLTNHFEAPYAYLRLENSAKTQLSADALWHLQWDGTTEIGYRPSLDPAIAPDQFYTFEGTAPGVFRLGWELIDSTDQTIIAADHALIELPDAPSDEADPQSVAGHFGEWNLRANGDSDFLPMADTSESVPEATWWRRNPGDPRIESERRQQRLQQAVFFVHGFNENVDDARQGKNRPIYKRLFWAGIPIHRYQGAQFIAVQWPGDLGRFNLFDSVKYNFDVFNAFHAGNRLGQLWDRKMNEPGVMESSVIHVMAHSLGNCVVGQAIQSMGFEKSARISTFSLLEAAITASAFDFGEQSTPAHSRLESYAALTGYATNSVSRDAIWTQRWNQAGTYFNYLNPDAWNVTPTDSILPATPYPPWSSQGWQDRWAYEARHFVAYRTNELQTDSIGETYSRRWSQPVWGADGDPWRGVFNRVVQSTQMHNFCTPENFGEEISSVLRMSPPLFNLGFTEIPCPWLLCQAQMRPEDATDPLFGWTNQDGTDPDQSDTWDEDLPQQPWHRALPYTMTNGWTEAEIKECRHFAELAHYFVELTPATGVTEMQDGIFNHVLRDLRAIMDESHSYFVETREYWVVYPQVWQIMQSYMVPIIQKKAE